MELIDLGSEQTTPSPPRPKPRPVSIAALPPNAPSVTQEVQAALKRPPPPARPRPPVMQPNKGPPSTAVLQDKPPQAPPTTAGKKRLEITVVEARPMSEVGFRESRAKSPPHSPKPTITARLSSKPLDSSSVTKSTPVLSTAKTSSPPSDEHTRTGLLPGDTDPLLSNNRCQIGDDTSEAKKTSPRRMPTIIRPPAGNKSSQPVDCKEPAQNETSNIASVTSGDRSPDLSADPSGAAQSIVRSRPTVIKPPRPSKEKPDSLPIKKDPWNQIVKGPGPVDNLAFSTGDTPTSSQCTVVPRSYKDTNKVSQPESSESSESLIDFSTHLPTEREQLSTAESDVETFFFSMGPIKSQTSPAKSLDAVPSEAKSDIKNLSKSCDTPGAKIKPVVTQIKPAVPQAKPAAPHAKPTTVPQAKPTGPHAKPEIQHSKPQVLKEITEVMQPKPHTFQTKQDSAESKSETPQGKPGFLGLKPEVPTSGPEPLQTKPEYTHPMQLGSSSLSAKSPDTQTAAETHATVSKEVTTRPKPPVPAMVKSKSVETNVSLADSSVTTEPPLPPRPKEGHPLYHYMLNGPHAIALHDYTSSMAGELQFKEGDVIQLKRRVNDEWLVGVSMGQEGMFPESFVEIRIPLEEVVQESVDGRPSISSGPRCVARFDFESSNPDDLTFIEGDMIRLLERVDVEWMKGELNGKIGLFPLAFVELVEDLPEQLPETVSKLQKVPDRNTQLALPQDTTQASLFCQAVAVYDFDSELATDMPFKAGQNIKVTHRSDVDWLFGECGSRSGVFPAIFVTITQGDTMSLPELNPAPAEELTVAKMGTGKYDFVGQGNGELTFQAGDRVYVVRRVDSDWSEGMFKRKTGLFPTEFVVLDS